MAEQLIGRMIAWSCCGWVMLADPVQLEKSNEIGCPECQKPGIIRGSNDEWYYIGGKVFP